MIHVVQKIWDKSFILFIMTQLTFLQLQLAFHICEHFFYSPIIQILADESIAIDWYMIFIFPIVQSFN